MRKLYVIAIIGLATSLFSVSTAFAGSDNHPKADHSDYWKGVWEEFKNDWKAIGNDFKDTGAKTGHTLKNEFREMPENIRQGCKKAKDDLKNLTGSERVNSNPPN